MQVIFLKNIKVWLIAGFIFTAVFGTLSHFFYDWSGENPLIGLISPVNESTWGTHETRLFPRSHLVFLHFSLCFHMNFLPSARLFFSAESSAPLRSLSCSTLIQVSWDVMSHGLIF